MLRSGVKESESETAHAEKEADEWEADALKKEDEWSEMAGDLEQHKEHCNLQSEELQKALTHMQEQEEIEEPRHKELQRLWRLELDEKKERRPGGSRT